MAILVVDDSRAMRMIVRRELRMAGYEDVVEAENGAAALETVRAGSVDLVLSDWNMPDMNGMELLTSLRAEGNAVMFGFVTSESAPETRTRALELGASFVLTKPFSAEDLDREICAALDDGGITPGFVGGQADRTIQSVLEGLLGRDVTITPSTPPARQLARGAAEYDVGADGRKAYAVVEMPLAASLACALARIPATEAQEWGKAHAFSDVIEANFFEVANVLAPFVAPGKGRCVVQAVHALGEGELWKEIRDSSGWHTNVKIDVDGYPSGHLGFVTA